MCSNKEPIVHSNLLKIIVVNEIKKEPEFSA